MPDTLPNIKLTAGVWTDLYAASGIAVGTAIMVENTGDQDIYLTVSATEPSTDVTPGEYNVLQRNNGVRLKNTSGDAGAWAFCQNPEGKINVAPADDAGFYPPVWDRRIAELAPELSDDDGSALKVVQYIKDEFGEIARVMGDNIFQGTPVVIDVPHHEIHCGDSYEATQDEDLPNNGTLDILIIVPDEPGTGQAQKLYHLIFVAESEAGALVEFFEGTDVSANGTAVPSFNRNRNSALVDFLGIFNGPTINNDGTLIYRKPIGAGRQTGGMTGRQNEIVLANNTNYLLRISNTTNATNKVFAELDYYVHPGV